MIGLQRKTKQANTPENFHKFVRIFQILRKLFNYIQYRKLNFQCFYMINSFTFMWHYVVYRKRFHGSVTRIFITFMRSLASWRFCPQLRQNETRPSPRVSLPSELTRNQTISKNSFALTKTIHKQTWSTYPFSLDILRRSPVHLSWYILRPGKLLTIGNDGRRMLLQE